jgi:hypothetical protein
MFSADALRAEGFSGFVPLLTLDTSKVPSTGGVYVVLRESDDPPAYLAVSPAGHFKKKDPTVGVAKLEAKWVHGCAVVYVGKGDNLRRRLTEYRDFGAGKAVGHYGGRYLWQLSDAASLVVCWRETPGKDPEDVEGDLLTAFKAAYGKYPFANHRGKRKN